MSSVIILTALVGSTLFVSYIPKVREAHICLSENNTPEKSECYLPMKLTHLNACCPVFTHKFDNGSLSYNNYFKIKYFFGNNSNITSEWMRLEKNTVCSCTVCYISLSLLIILNVLFVIILIWKKYRH